MSKKEPQGCESCGLERAKQHDERYFKNSTSSATTPMM